MPRIEDILDKIGKAKFITTLDLACGYWQVPVADEDRHKTAFTSPFGLYQFCVMPFELNGAPATFQRLMNELVRDIKNLAQAYLDDLVVYTQRHTVRAPEPFADSTGKVTRVWLDSKMTECQWAMGQCTYLGHVIGGDHVKPEMNKLEAEENFLVPKTKKEV